MEAIEVQERQRVKSSQAQLLRVLAQDYALAPRIAKAVVQEVQDYLLADHDGGQPGQILANLACHNAGHGQPLQKIGTVSVRWTVDAGESDKEIGRSQGQVALRRHRIVRLLDEATAQGGLATQEDLAETLGVAVRTIKRDFAHLHKQGHFLPSRGYRQGIGRGQSHKVQIIEQWLSHATYDQIMERTRHSLDAIRRYIQSFVRIVELHQQQMSPEQIGFITETSTQLVERYLAIYDAIQGPEERERLQSELERMAAKRPSGKKRGAS